MGMNNEGAMRYVVDIETVPIPNAAEFLDLSDISAPSNWKDEEKIRAYCQEKQADMVAKAALDLDLCQIVAMGWQREDWSEPEVYTTQTRTSEAEILTAFWHELDDRVTVGYNSLGFDLPVLLRRSLYLGVPAPRLSLNKYRTSHLDLQQILSHEGTKPYRSLNWYCKRWGITVPDDTAGKDIGRLVAEGDWEAVRAHCRADVLKTKALAERVGVLQQYAAPVESVL